jgi:diadenosine tetraphosphate (Ap4A) HIT family hydrolase
VVAGDLEIPGGILLRHGGFVLHAVAAPSPIRGWLVLTSERHVRAPYALDEGESAELGRLMAQVMRAQLTALGAEHVYTFAIADKVQHCHVHLVPRFADTPERLRGTRCFEAGSDDALSPEILAHAAEAVRLHLLGVGPG